MTSQSFRSLFRQVVTNELFVISTVKTDSGPVNYAGAIDVKPGFHNTGLYNTDGKGGYPVSDRGLFDLTAEANDMGKFRAPTLRNIEFTAPYMHDGSIDTLAAVIDHYARGESSRNPFQDPLISGF